MPIPEEVREAGAKAICRANPEWAPICLDNGPAGRAPCSTENCLAARGFAAALSALEAAGWACVPKEITLEMQHAYFNVIDKNMERVETDASFGRYASNKEAYAAMLASTQGKEQADG